MFTRVPLLRVMRCLRSILATVNRETWTPCVSDMCSTISSMHVPGRSVTTSSTVASCSTVNLRLAGRGLWFPRWNLERLTQRCTVRWDTLTDIAVWAVLCPSLMWARARSMHVQSNFILTGQRLASCTVQADMGLKHRFFDKREWRLTRATILVPLVNTNDTDEQARWHVSDHWCWPHGCVVYRKLAEQAHLVVSFSSRQTYTIDFQLELDHIAQTHGMNSHFDLARQEFTSSRCWPRRLGKSHDRTQSPQRV